MYICRTSRASHARLLNRTVSFVLPAYCVNAIDFSLLAAGAENIPYKNNTHNFSSATSAASEPHKHPQPDIKAPPNLYSAQPKMPAH